MARRGSWFGECGKHLAIGFVLLFAFYPFWLMFLISMKSNEQFLNNPFGWTMPLHFENWVVAWGIVGGYISNSIVVAISACALLLACSVLAAYVFGRYAFPGQTVLWYALLCLMLLPTVANLVPLFFTIKTLGLLNTLSALILVGAAGGQVVCIYILRNFIEDIPPDLFDAAEVDGAGFVNQIVNIVLPMCGPILGTLAILQFLGNWNRFVLPMIVLREPSMYTIPVGLMMLSGEYDKHWGQLMAGYMIASIPLIILFVFTMRFFVKGLGAGAVKG